MVCGRNAAKSIFWKNEIVQNAKSCTMNWIKSFNFIKLKTCKPGWPWKNMWARQYAFVASYPCCPCNILLPLISDMQLFFKACSKGKKVAWLMFAVSNFILDVIYVFSFGSLRWLSNLGRSFSPVSNSI